jgi:hypothetical protein
VLVRRGALVRQVSSRPAMATEFIANPLVAGQRDDTRVVQP